MDSKINLYDPFISNKMVNGSQMIFMWHVDDLKISHKYPREVTQFILPIENIYGEGITVTRGKVHYYLGMDFNFSNQVTTKLLMVNYAAQILDDFPEVLTTYATSIPAEHLFQIRETGRRNFQKNKHRILTTVWRSSYL